MARSSEDERRSVRTPVILAATLRYDGARPVPVRIANLSATGALVFGDEIPHEDETVTLTCNGVEIRGWVVWAGKSHAGINFDEAIEPGDVLPKPRIAADVIVKDSRNKEFKRPGFRGNQLSAEEQAILEAWKRGT